MSHDRTGARLDGDERSPVPCDCGRRGCLCDNPACRRGWIGGRDKDHPDPCRVCKPWLADGTLKHEPEQPR